MASVSRMRKVPYLVALLLVFTVTRQVHFVRQPTQTP